MRKSAKDLIMSLIVLFSIIALIGFLGWATNGFKSLDRFKQWFGLAQTAIDKFTDSDKESIAVKAPYNNGVILDSDDAELTVDVVYCDPPVISFSYMTDYVSVYMYTYNYSVPNQVKGNACQIDVIPFRIMGVESEPDYAKRKTLTVFSYGGFTGTHPTQSINTYEIRQSDIRRLFPEQFTDGCGNEFMICAKSLSYGNYYESKEVSLCVYISASDPTVEFDGTTVKISKISVDTLPAWFPIDAEEYFFNSIRLNVGNFYSGSWFAPCDHNFSKPSLGGSNNHVYDSPAFTEDENYVYCDLTKLSFVSTVGQYSIYFEHNINAVVSPGSTGGGAYWFNNVNVLRDYKLYSFEITKLPTPTNITFENKLLSWDYEDSSVEFAVFDGNNLLGNVNETAYDLSNYQLTEGEHIFRIRALGNVGSKLADTAEITPFNASSNIRQLVALTYYIGDESLTKLVPYGKNIGDYLYDVVVDGKIFGGWYKDPGYSIAVEPTSKLIGDVSVYARLSDAETTDRPLSWWEKNMWYIIGPIIGIVIISIIVVAIKVARDRKAA